jgi:two-component system sensor histidine kinase HydH
MRRALAANSTAMTRLGATMIASATLTALLGAGMLWLLFSGILSPLRKMAAEVRAASDDGGAGTAPGPGSGSDNEVAEIGYYLHAIVSELAEARSTARQERSRDDQAARLAALGTAVAHVAHEFKNALTSIGGFARLIEQHPEDPGRVREQAAIIARVSARLEQLVRETVDYSRPNTVEPVVQPLNAAVREALAGLAGRVPEGVKLETDLDPQVPDVPFDAAHLERVIANLVGNSLEAVGPRGAVRVRTRPWERGAELIVEDNGPGIPPEVRERLFEPFFTTKKKGSGLGLAICRQIVAGHGGSICHEPAPGGGTIFRVTLPG